MIVIVLSAENYSRVSEILALVWGTTETMSEFNPSTAIRQYASSLVVRH